MESVRLVTETLEKGWLTYRGPLVPQFESALSKYFGQKTIVCSSGTAAIHLALLALDIPRGSEVLIPNLTFATVASAVLAAGCTPVLCDVTANGTISRDEVERKLGRAKAVIPVHLYGEAADDLSDLPIPVIEDNCEGLGYVKPGRLTIYSFYANKLLTTGEGGAICCEDEGIRHDASLFRDGGHDENFRHTVPGLNYRMTAMQAAYGLGQLPTLEDRIAERQKYLDQLPAGPGKWMRLVKGQLTPALKAAGCRPVFLPLHRQPWMQTKEKFPVSDWLWSEHFCVSPLETPFGAYQLWRAESRRKELAG